MYRRPSDFGDAKPRHTGVCRPARLDDRLEVSEVNTGAARREACERVLEAAQRREIDLALALVWRLDRCGRSVTDLAATLQELEHLGFGFVSLTEALDVATPTGRAMGGVVLVFSEFERRSCGNEPGSGLAHARENGKRLGRLAIAASTLRKSGNCVKLALAKSEITRRVQIGRTSVRRILV
jgi:DNA invertase Pin-like site-specific DNA recombinase